MRSHIWMFLWQVSSQQSMFKQYGLEEPKTLADLENICATLKENGITPLHLLMVPNGQVPCTSCLWQHVMADWNHSRMQLQEPANSQMTASSKQVRRFRSGLTTILPGWRKLLKRRWRTGKAVNVSGDRRYASLAAHGIQEHSSLTVRNSIRRSAGSHSCNWWFDADPTIQIGTVGDQFISFNCEGDKLAAFECTADHLYLMKLCRRHTLTTRLFL